MVIARSSRRAHILLVERTDPAKLPDVIVDPCGRTEILQLTQQLVEVLIKMIDLTDGDPDQEPNGDEFEDSDGL